tara:strand:- start:413 stop:880 length:468 start_codon:yes stop_codon:yes gene_type:complete
MICNNEMKEFEFELAAEIDRVCDRVHRLLVGSDGVHYWDGSQETQQVVLTLPKGLVHLAEFLGVMSRTEKSDLEGLRSSLHFWKYVSGMGHDDPTPRRNLTRMRRAFLERELEQGLSLDLRLMATGALDFRPTSQIHRVKEHLESKDQTLEEKNV